MKPIVVVSGVIANKPHNGGNARMVLNWLVGLERLGADVYFVEQLSSAASVDDAGAPAPATASANRAYFDRVLKRYGFERRSALVCDATSALDDARVCGLSEAELRDLSADADLLINISGHLSCASLKNRFRRKAYVDVDPGYTQLWPRDGGATRRSRHVLHRRPAHWHAEAACCRRAASAGGRCGRRWSSMTARSHPRSRPAHSRRWPAGAARSRRSAHDGVLFGSKAHQFRKIVELPRLVPHCFEVALDIHQADDTDACALRRTGWRVVDPRAVASTPEDYEAYVAGSLAECSAAQGMYVQSRCGWFSDRTAQYLAAGKPVLVQDTGFCPPRGSGEGVVVFETRRRSRRRRRADRPRLPRARRSRAGYRHGVLRLGRRPRTTAGRGRRRVKKGHLVMADDLPELQSDEDVDALMSRLSARLEPTRRPSALSDRGLPDGDPLEALLAAEAQCLAATHRAIELVVEWINESRPSDAVRIPTKARPNRSPRQPAAPARRRRSAPADRRGLAPEAPVMRVAIVTPRMASGECGGAEALYRGLLNAFREASHEADEIAVESDESSFDAVLESYARFYALDLRDYDLVVSTKAPTFMVSHPNHASYLLHTLRVFYDMFAHEYGEGTAEQHAQRRAIHALDRFGLRQGRIRRHFSNGHTTYRRLVEASPWWQEVGFSALHHPPALSGFKGSRRQDFILLPGRLHRWKRAHLIIDAYKHLKRDVPLLITGTGEDEAALRKAAAGDRRIRFLGGVSEAELVDLYADALLVPFVPRQEDYGLVTIEAFKSGKPVLTCSDSGETLEFVRDGVNGYVVEPDARAIAARLTDAIDHRRAAAAMGAAGQRSVSHIAWEPIVEALIGSPRRSPAVRVSTPAAPRASTALAVTVLDMQPIDPPVGGGRLRLLGLYHALGAGVQTTYVGTYDWPGMPHRRHTPQRRRSRRSTSR